MTKQSSKPEVLFGNEIAWKYKKPAEYSAGFRFYKSVKR